MQFFFYTIIKHQEWISISSVYTYVLFKDVYVYLRRI